MTIEIRNLCKSFKDVKAVQNVNLIVESGESVALLGPNGAGKTTLVEMIEGVQYPDSGEIHILDRSWEKDENILRKQIGIALQETRFLERLTVEETLNLKDYQNIYCVFLSNEKRKIKFDDKVINFKKKIIEDQVNRFSNIKIIDEINFDKYTNEIKDLDVIYPSIGENLSFLKSIKKKKNLNYNFIVRDGDEFCWQFSNKGYFNFKSNIPKIIQKIT